MPKVSVIIPVYNAERFISETLDSVIGQTYGDWEIVAVDDGSRDRSLDILKRYRKRFPAKVRVISQRNSGVSAARNAAIKASKGEYMAFLDHDDLWLPGKLEKQVRLLDSNPNLGMVYSDSIVVDKGGRPKKGTMVHNRFARGRVFDKLFVQNFMPLLTVVARKDAIRKAGGFDPKYRTAEEYDLWLKIAERFPVDFVAQPLAKYRVHDGNFSRNIELSTKEELRIMGFWAGRMRVPSSFVRKRHALIYLRTGWAFYKDREFSKCVRYCLKAIRKRPLSCKAYAVLAFSLIRSGALLKIAGRFGARLSF